MAVETAKAPIPVTDAAGEAIAGGYDLQVPVAPDVIARHSDDLDLAKEFAARKLNVGGLNPVALEIAGRKGGTNVKLPLWAQIQRSLSDEGISPPPLTVPAAVTNPTNLVS